MKVTVEQLTNIVPQATSIRQALLMLGLAAKGSNYATIKKRIKKYNIDTSHFTGHLHNKGRTFPSKTPTEQYLTNAQPIGSNRLRLRLIKEGILQPICSNCNLKMWLGDPIPLELDHINGNPEDNSLSNLRLLCPNCHALTSTYRGRNIKKA